MTRFEFFLFVVVVTGWPDLHSRFYRGGRGVARLALSLLSWWPRSGPINILTFIVVAAEWPDSFLISIVVAAEWPDLAFSLIAWWPRSDPISIPPFHRGGRGVARLAFSLQSGWPRSGPISILLSIVVAAEWPD